MNPSDIKAKIAQAGTSQAAIATYLGVSAGSVARVIRGNLRSQRIEAELSKIVGQPLFPGTPKKAGRPKSVWTGEVVQPPAPVWDGVERRSGKDRRKTVQPTPVSQPNA